MTHIQACECFTSHARRLSNTKLSLQFDIRYINTSKWKSATSPTECLDTAAPDMFCKDNIEFSKLWTIARCKEVEVLSDHADSQIRSPQHSGSIHLEVH